MKHFLLIFSILICQAVKAQTGSFSFEGIVRDYIIHLPASYNSINSYPLVLNLHGQGSTAQEQLLYTEMNAVADTGNFIVVYPNAIANAWNIGYEMTYNSGVNDVGFLSALIDTVANNYSVDKSRVYSCGMSRGGFMSYRLACELNDKIAAIASVTGSMADSVIYYCQSQNPIPVLQFHGTADSTVLYLGTPYYPSADSLINYWVNKNNCNTNPLIDTIPDIVNEGSDVIKYSYGSGNDSSEVIFFKINNGGHSWPGAIAVPGLGNTNQDIDATAEIWNFFRKHKSTPAFTTVKEVADESQTLIFPNPFNNEVEIQITSNVKSLKLIDYSGKLIEEFNDFRISEKSIKLTTTRLLSGMYFLQIISEKGIQIQKIIKY